MARPLRPHVPMQLYHVRSRGNDRRPLFRDDDDHLEYLELIADAAKRFKVRCYSYCLMSNHTHLMLQPTEHPLSRFMHKINGNFAQWSNRRHKRTGHLFEGRFKASLVENSVYYLRLLRYIARNPVVAKLVDAPAGWRWSSYRATAGLSPAPPFLDVKQVWRCFDRHSHLQAQRVYEAFVGSDTDDDEEFAGLLVGSPTFVQSLETSLLPHRSVRDFTYAERFCTRPLLRDLLARVPPGPQLDAAVGSAFLTHAYTLREIGECLDRPPGTIWLWVRRARMATEAGAPRERRTTRRKRPAGSRSDSLRRRHEKLRSDPEADPEADRVRGRTRD